MSCFWKCGDCCRCLSPVPDGCSSCFWFEPKCKWLIDRKGTETHCDWTPSKYQRGAEATPTEAP